MKNHKIIKILGFYLRRLKKRFFNLFGVHELPKNATLHWAICMDRKCPLFEFLQPKVAYYYEIRKFN